MVSDISICVVEVVISHIFHDGSHKVIAQAGISLIPAQRNNGEIEKEYLTIIFAINKFRKMLYGHKFTLITDHKPQVYNLGKKSFLNTWQIRYKDRPQYFWIMTYQ